jgi:8-oxo-dGTP pyrophosphatase MutT (NUDIX family)
VDGDGADPVEALRSALLTPDEARAMDAHGKTEAAVLLPMFGFPEAPGLIFTERRIDMRRHAGEISFPGGRRDGPDEDLLRTALREGEEEIGLDPAAVELVGALPPVGTYVTNYKVYPFVGLVPSNVSLALSPAEVAKILHLRLEDLRGGFEMKRLFRRGMPIKTPTYTVEEHLIWGATARILGELLDRLTALR